jgi:hypothetical protein
MWVAYYSNTQLVMNNKQNFKEQTLFKAQARSTENLAVASYPVLPD